MSSTKLINPPKSATPVEPMTPDPVAEQKLREEIAANEAKKSAQPLGAKTASGEVAGAYTAGAPIPQKGSLMIRKLNPGQGEKRIDWENEPKVIIEAISETMVINPLNRKEKFLLRRGERAEVPLALAKQLEQPIEGHFSFAGERFEADFPNGKPDRFVFTKVRIVPPAQAV